MLPNCTHCGEPVEEWDNPHLDSRPIFTADHAYLELQGGGEYMCCGGCAYKFLVEKGIITEEPDGE